MIEDLSGRIEETKYLVERLKNEIAKVIVGQKSLIERLLIGLFTKGHILIEGVPGLAKTLTVKVLAAVIQADFKRIQFTPDLLPADILGTEVYQPKTGEFLVKKGPLFHNIILADEINRAPSKVQSALLEAMQERQITLGGQTFSLPDPFLVLATQNPIEQEGTYPLPEAQVDRFMLKLKIDYPTKDEEREVVKRFGVDRPIPLEPILSPARLNEISALIGEVLLDEKLLDYILDLVQATRHPEKFGLRDLVGYIEYGASPRAAIFISLAARAYAFLKGRAFVTPQDIKTAAPDVLRHRIILSYEAEAEDVTPEQVITRIFDSVEVP
ncbi:MAG: MoxR family ATPase [Pseudomonadota bacterium]